MMLHNGTGARDWHRASHVLEAAVIVWSCDYLYHNGCLCDPSSKSCCACCEYADGAEAGSLWVLSVYPDLPVLVLMEDD